MEACTRISASATGLVCRLLPKYTPPNRLRGGWKNFQNREERGDSSIGRADKLVLLEHLEKGDVEFFAVYFGLSLKIHNI